MAATDVPAMLTNPHEVSSERLPAFSAYFASRQRSVDIFQSVFILTLGQACQCIRVVQIAVCDSAASAAPATLSGFPCDGGELEQGLWVLARFPWLAWVLARDFYWLELPWAVVLESVILVAAILQPRWYLQGGRTVLYPLLRIGLAGLVFFEMLLAPSNPILLATASVCYLGSKGIMFLFFAVLCKNSPLRLHALTCTCAWLFMALYNITYCYKHGGSMPGVLVNILTAQLVIGVAVPVLVARLQTRSLWARYHALQALRGRQAASKVASAAAPEAASKAASTAGLRAPSEAASKSGSQVPGNKLDASRPAVADNMGVTAAAAAATAAVPPAASRNIAPAGAIGARRSLYRPRCNTRRVSIKVHHHEAFDDRRAILVAVQECLHTSSAVPTIPPAAISTPTPAAPRSIQAITSIAITGCLQLILSVTGLSSPHTSSSSASPWEEGGGLAAALYDSLPAACRTSRVTIQVGLTATYFSAPHCSSADGDINGASGGALQRVQQVVAMEALAVQPLVLQSGLEEVQVLEVQLPGSCMAGALKVVAVADAGGRQVHSVEEVAAAAGTCRLTLPPSLDPGPVALHVVSAEGLLLASCCTAALPPPAAQELQQLLLDCTPDSDCGSSCADDVRAELEAVLEDLAAVWQLSRSGGGGAVDAGDLIACFHDNNPGSCKAALEQQLGLTPPTRPARGLVPLLKTAAATARRLVGGCCWALAGSSGWTGAAAAGPAGQPTVGWVAAGSSSGQGGSWMRYPNRLGSIIAAVVLAATCGSAWASLQKRRALVGTSGPSPPQTGALIVLHGLLMVGQHLWVAMWGPIRARRATVVVLQTAAKSVLYLAPLLWPAMSGEWVSAEHARSQLLVEGVMRPCINQVPWALQLLMSVCELACMAAGCRWGRSDPTATKPCRPVGLPWYALIALTAGAVSVIVQRLPGVLARPPRSRCSATSTLRHKSE